MDCPRFWSSGTAASFYQNIYNPEFTEIVGLLELRIGRGLMQKFYKAIGMEGDWEAILLPFGTAIIEDTTARMDEETRKLLGASDTEPYYINRKTIVNHLSIEELGVRLFVVGKVDVVFHTIKRKEIILISTVVVFWRHCR